LPLLCVGDRRRLQVRWKQTPLPLPSPRCAAQGEGEDIRVFRPCPSPPPGERARVRGQLCTHRSPDRGSHRFRAPLARAEISVILRGLPPHPATPPGGGAGSHRPPPCRRLPWREHCPPSPETPAPRASSAEQLFATNP